MKKASPLGLLAVVLVLAASVWWLLGSGATPAPAPTTVSAPADAAAPQAPAVAQGENGANERAKVDVPRAAPAVADGPALVGRVVDENGAPVAKAKVAPSAVNMMDPRSFPQGDFNPEDPSRFLDAMRERMRERTFVETGVDGTFRLVVVGTGPQVQIEARAAAYLPASKGAARPAGADVDVGTLVLKRGARIQGRVVDAQSQPVANASVLRMPKDGGAGGGPGGAMFGFGGRGGQGGGQGGGPGGMGGMGFGQPGMDFFGGEALDLMRGMLGDAVTDADGNFDLPNEAPGEFTLRVRHTQHPTATREGLSVVAGQTLADVLIVLQPGADIAGRVTDIPPGTPSVRVLAAAPRAAPAAGGQVNDMLGGMGAQIMDMIGDFALAAERSAEVKDDGTFAIQGLPVGQRFRVWVTQGGRGFLANAVCSQRVEVQSGTTGVELKYDPGVVVTAKVVDAKTQKPVEVLWVRDQFEGGGMADMMNFVQGMTRGGRSRNVPDGQLALTNLRPKPKQKLRLTIEAIGYRKWEKQDIELPEHGVVDLGTLGLERTPVVRVEVKTKAGAPVQGATVRLRSQNGDDPAAMFGGGRMGMAMAMGGGGPMGMLGMGGIGTARTDERGRAVLNAVTDSSIVVLVTATDYAPYQSEAVAPRADADTEQKVTLLVGGSAAVRVLDTDGKEVAEARIEHQTPTGDNDTRAADAAGMAVFDHLAPGTHRFRLAAQNGPLGGMQGMFQRGGRNRGGNGGANSGGGTNGGAAAAGEAAWQTLEIQDEARAELALAKDATAVLTGIVRENGQPLAQARVQFVQGPGDEPAAAAAAPAGGNRDPMAGMMEAFGQMAGGGGRSERTDDQGRYTLKDLKTGEHRVRVTTNGRSMATTMRVFLRSGPNVLDVDLDSASLRGTVVDAAGKPVAGAQVRVTAASDTTPSLDGMMQGFNLGGRGGRGGMNFGNMLGGSAPVITEADGRFELKGVQTGVPLIVRASAMGFAGGESAPVQATAGALKDGIEVKLRQGGTVKVQAAGDQPFAAVVATWAGEDGVSVAPAFALLSNGTAKFEGLRPGAWRIALQTGMGGMFGGRRGGRGNGGNNASAGGANEGRIVTVVAGQTVEVAL